MGCQSDVSGLCRQQVRAQRRLLAAFTDAERRRSGAMGKLQEFDITFANNKVVYSPGESIRGTVKIRTGNSLQYKGNLQHFHTEGEKHVSASVSFSCCFFSEARGDARCK